MMLQSSFTRAPCKSLKLYIHKFYFCSNVEIWKPIPGYSKYAASTSGNIKKLRTNQLLEGESIGRGDLPCKMVITDDGKKRKVTIARLVAMAFHQNEYEEGMEAYNIDGDIFNNKPDNLQLVNDSDPLYPRLLNHFSKPVTLTHIDSGQKYRFATILRCIAFLEAQGIELNYQEIKSILDTESTKYGYKFERRPTACK